MGEKGWGPRALAWGDGAQSVGRQWAALMATESQRRDSSAAAS